MVAVCTSATSNRDFPLIRRFAAPSPPGEGVSRWCFHNLPLPGERDQGRGGKHRPLPVSAVRTQVLPLDGEGGLPRSGKTEGVKAPCAFKALKATHSTTPAAWSPSPIKGEDLAITEATR